MEFYQNIFMPTPYWCHNFNYLCGYQSLDKNIITRSWRRHLSGYFCAFAIQQLNFDYRIILIGFIISGLVMFARLALNKHSPFQVYLGWSIAFTIAFICNLYYPLT